MITRSRVAVEGEMFPIIIFHMRYKWKDKYVLTSSLLLLEIILYGRNVKKPAYEYPLRHLIPEVTGVKKHSSNLLLYMPGRLEDHALILCVECIISRSSLRPQKGARQFQEIPFQNAKMPNLESAHWLAKCHRLKWITGWMTNIQSTCEKMHRNFGDRRTQKYASRWTGGRLKGVTVQLLLSNRCRINKHVHIIRWWWIMQVKGTIVHRKSVSSDFDAMSLTCHVAKVESGCCFSNISHLAHIFVCVMTSLREHNFRITGPFCGEC